MTLPERAAAASGAARSRSTIRDGARHGTLGPYSSSGRAARVVRGLRCCRALNPRPPRRVPGRHWAKMSSSNVEHGLAPWQGQTTYTLRPGGAADVTVAGEVDLYSLADFQATLDEAATASTGDVFVHLERLSFAGVACVDALMAANIRLQRTGRRLHLLRPSAQLLRLLTICRLERLLQ